jgi:hypothetical protein
MLHELVRLRDRSIHYVLDTRPAVYYLVDREINGVLINTPPFAAALHEALSAIAPVKFLFMPSRRGARDLDRWREATGAESLAFEAEVSAIEGGIDIALNRKTKLTRTIDFLPMAGATEGTCALRLKNKPGGIFFGPALSPGDDGWPTLIERPDDYSFENRLFGALGLQDLQFDYAFTDDFEPGSTRFGPGAAAEIKLRLEQALEA